ncbi:MAG TPA: hypothetical protein VHX64_00615 [Caulobacteraceae bacterium]|nr:hypothetical protein [Caulobacteraceae bacterium]
MRIRNIALCAAAAWFTIGIASAFAQEAAQDRQAGRPRSSMTTNLPAQDEAMLRAKHPELYVLPPVSHAYKPGRTPWGDPDLRGMWPTDSVGGLPLQRPEAMGGRVFLSEDELKARDHLMDQWRHAAADEIKSNHLGSGNWVEMTGAGRRTSMLIDPQDGRLPALTPEGKRAETVGRSSWVPNQSFDWVTDFDSWDRCVSRGFPASMLPFRYNNGLQIMQAPGYVVINLEMIHDARIIPLGGAPATPGVTNWMGESRGHWEGNTLVVETDHIRSGAAPINAATTGGPSPGWNTIPMSPKAHVTERFTLVGPNTLTYEMTYSDPVVWTAPFALRIDLARDEKYKFYEYACHEGDEQVRNYIVTSRIKRAKDKAAADQKAAEAAPAAGPKPS